MNPAKQQIVPTEVLKKCNQPNQTGKSRAHHSVFCWPPGGQEHNQILRPSGHHIWEEFQLPFLLETSRIFYCYTVQFENIPVQLTVQIHDIIYYSVLYYTCQSYSPGPWQTWRHLENFLPSIHNLEPLILYSSWHWARCGVHRGHQFITAGVPGCMPAEWDGVQHGTFNPAVLLV